MTDERYKRDIETLATTYWGRLGTDARFNEQEFIQNMRKRLEDDRPLTPNMKNCIDNMVRKYVKGEAPGTGKPKADAQELEPIERGRFSAYKCEGGWQIHIDGEKVGPPVDHRTARAVIYWLEDSLEQIQTAVAVPPEPANDEDAPF